MDTIGSTVDHLTPESDQSTHSTSMTVIINNESFVLKIDLDEFLSRICSLEPSYKKEKKKIKIKFLN